MIKERKEKRVEEARRETESLNSQIKGERIAEQKALQEKNYARATQHAERRIALQRRQNAARDKVFVGGRG